MPPLHTPPGKQPQPNSYRATFLLLSGLLPLVVAGVGAAAAQPPVVAASSPDSIAAYVTEAALRFGIPEAWIRAVMRVESRGDVRAVSPKGAMGLMQIMPTTWGYLSGRYALQSNDLKQALRPYCVGGAYGRLLDAEHEHLGTGTVQAFETEGLIGTGAAPAVLAYLFHRIEDRLTGAPTLIIVDEGWLALDDEGFAGQLREWLKTLRKKNASVVFATQSLSDIDGSPIAPAIIESCQTRLLLPNERAIEPQITAIYRRFGLNDRQIEILARATPKRDYYCQSRRGNRLFELGLGEVALALCAASSRTDQQALARTFAEHGRDGFLAAWLHNRGAAWAADLIPDLTNLETRP